MKQFSQKKRAIFYKKLQKNKEIGQGKDSKITASTPEHFLKSWNRLLELKRAKNKYLKRSTEPGEAKNTLKTPLHPYLILLSSLILPASGQVWNRQPTRGLIFLFFIFLLGGFTLITADPEVSFLGRYAGGFFVWAMAIFDAYKHARIRYTLWLYNNSKRDLS